MQSAPLPLPSPAPPACFSSSARRRPNWPTSSLQKPLSLKLRESPQSSAAAALPSSPFGSPARRTESAAALWSAAEGKNASLVEKLAMRGADVTRGQRGATGGGTLLHVACRNIDADLAVVLLAHVRSDLGAGGAASFANAVDTLYSGVTPLLEVARAPGGLMVDRCAIADALLAHGARLDAADGHGDTCFHWAARTGNLALVRHLIARHAQRGAVAVLSSAVNLKGRTAVDVATIALGGRGKAQGALGEIRTAVAGAALRSKMFYRGRALEREAREAAELRAGDAACVAEAARAARVDVREALRDAAAREDAARQTAYNEYVAGTVVDAVEQCHLWLETRHGKRALRTAARGSVVQEGAAIQEGISAEHIERAKESLVASAETDARITATHEVEQRKQADARQRVERVRAAKKKLEEDRAANVQRLRSWLEEDIDEETGMCSLELMEAEGADQAAVEATTSVTFLLAALRSL